MIKYSHLRLRSRIGGVHEIFEAGHGSPEGKELDVLVDLIEFCGSRNFPMGSSNIAEERAKLSIETGRI